MEKTHRNGQDNSNRPSDGGDGNAQTGREPVGPGLPLDSAGSTVPATAADSPLPVVAGVTEVEADALNLSSAQRTAIALLIAGRTRADAATAAGIGRTTLYRWINDDPAFIAALNSWQADIRTTVQSQLMAATHEAAGVVINAIRKGDSGLAWKLLQSQQMATPRVTGPTDTDEAKFQAVLDRKYREIERRKKQWKVSSDELASYEPPI